MKKCVINVTTNWQDHCEINCGISNTSGVLTEEKLHCDSFDNEEFSFSQMLNESVEASRSYGTIKMQVLSDSTLLISAADTNADFIYLSLKIPENFNMSFQARELEIIVRNKFQGDFSRRTPYFPNCIKRGCTKNKWIRMNKFGYEKQISL